MRDRLHLSTANPPTLCRFRCYLSIPTYNSAQFSTALSSVSKEAGGDNGATLIVVTMIFDACH
jgi:hypothetical protein